MSGPARAGAEHRVLGRYRLLERLGSGGFGEVWRAEDTQLCRQVALKWIHAGAAAAGQRSAREAQAAARLAHPAIVALYEAAHEDGACFLISELIEGATLAELTAEEALSDEEIIEIGLALCDALSHAHARGVIHRDVKPQNILVPDERAEGTAAAKLTDFGGAKLDGEEALTRAGDILGTLAYMAPEQSDGLPARRESDLYSLALVLYEALSGENPIRAPTPAATARRIGSRLLSLRRLRGDLPRCLSTAIDTCLRPDPEDRGEISDLAAALHAALAELPDAPRQAPPEARTVWREGLATQSLRPRRGLPAASTLTAAFTSRTRVAGELPQRQRSAPRLPERRPPGSGAQPGVPGALGESPAAGSAGRERSRSAGPLALPRAAWTLLTAAAVIWQTASGRPGLALVLLVAVVPLLVLMPSRGGPLWLSGALAPVLGLAGFAAAYPALAGRHASVRMRLALGGVGFWWLGIGELVFGRALPPALTLRSATRSAAAASTAAVRPGADPFAWERSLSGGAHALGPLLSAPVAAGVALWAVGAAVLPWLVRSSGIAVDLAFALALSAALTLGPALLAGVVGGGHLGLSHSAVSAVVILAAVLGALLAVGARQLGKPP